MKNDTKKFFSYCLGSLKYRPCITETKFWCLQKKTLEDIAIFFFKSLISMPSWQFGTCIGLLPCTGGHSKISA